MAQPISYSMSGVKQDEIARLKAQLAALPAPGWESVDSAPDGHVYGAWSHGADGEWGWFLFSTPEVARLMHHLQKPIYRLTALNHDGTMPPPPERGGK
jgi:hypothetical protein